HLTVTPIAKCGKHSSTVTWRSISNHLKPVLSIRYRRTERTFQLVSDNWFALVGRCCKRRNFWYRTKRPPRWPTLGRSVESVESSCARLKILVFNQPDATPTKLRSSNSTHRPKI